MKVVILAGGYGTRISEESNLRPKPMIEIGDMPILWHIMKSYSHYGFNDFIICCGYKGYMIKEYFANYYLHRSNITFDFTDNNAFEIHQNIAEPWRVTLADTGLDTMTGGRVKRVAEFIGDEPFLLTYGDGVSDVNMNDLIAFHKENKKLVTLTAIQPSGRFGTLEIGDQNEILQFKEKHKEDTGWINGGYMVIEPEFLDLIDGDDTVLEQYPLIECARRNELIAYKHKGFWQCMDTLRDKMLLESLIKENKAPWIKW